MRLGGVNHVNVLSEMDTIGKSSSVLEIGFGCGYSADRIQHWQPKSGPTSNGCKRHRGVVVTHTCADGLEASALGVKPHKLAMRSYSELEGSSGVRTRWREGW